MELFVILRIFCNPETQFSQHRESRHTVGRSRAHSCHTVVTPCTISLSRHTVRPRPHTVRILALVLRHTVRIFGDSPGFGPKVAPHSPAVPHTVR